MEQKLTFLKKNIEIKTLHAKVNRERTTWDTRLNRKDGKTEIGLGPAPESYAKRVLRVAIAGRRGQGWRISAATEARRSSGERHCGRRGARESNWRWCCYWRRMRACGGCYCGGGGCCYLGLRRGFWRWRRWRSCYFWGAEAHTTSFGVILLLLFLLVRRKKGEGSEVNMITMITKERTMMSVEELVSLNPHSLYGLTSLHPNPIYKQIFLIT